MRACGRAEVQVGPAGERTDRMEGQTGRSERDNGKGGTQMTSRLVRGNLADTHIRILFPLKFYTLSLLAMAVPAQRAEPLASHGFPVTTSIMSNCKK